MKTQPDSGTVFLGFLWIQAHLIALFIALKLTGVITWSWLWVLSPYWIPVALLTAAIPFAAIYDLLRRK